MFRYYSLLTLIIIAAVWLSACGRIQQSRSQDEAITIEMLVEPAQSRIGPANLVFTVTDKAGRSIDDAMLEVEDNMVHAGMSSVLARATTDKDEAFKCW